MRVVVEEFPVFTIAIPSAYLLGSVPTGLIVVKVLKGVDIRQQGSGKIGATNVLRTLGWLPAVVVLLADVLKGVAAVLLARLVASGANPTVSDIAQGLAAIMAVAGHNWPVYAGFRGGRGVATSVGTLLVIVPPLAIFSFILGALAILLSDMASIGSLIGTLAAFVVFAALIAFGQISPSYILYAVICAGLVFLQHWDNIQRLLKGEERRLGLRAKAFEWLRRSKAAPTDNSKR